MPHASALLKNAGTMVVAATLTIGCASRGLYSEVGGEFSKGYESASNIILESLGTSVRDTRRLAIVHYVQNGDDDTNLDSSDIDESFRRYVCAGTGLYPNQRKALKVLGAYRRIIADLSSEPSEEIGALWASINRLREPREPLQFEDADSNAFRSCLVRLQVPANSREPSLVPPKGEPIEDLTREAPAAFAAYESFATLVEAAKALAVKGLRQIDEAARAKAVKEFVLRNQDTIARFIGTINEDGSYNEGEIRDKVLKRVLDARRRSALIVPYYEFQRLFLLNRTTQAAAVVEQGETVHLALQEFDALRWLPDPRNVVSVMRRAQAELIRLANGELEPAEAWGVFKAFADTLGELHEAFIGVTDAARAL